jgi:integrase
MPRLSKALVDQLQPRAKDYFVWDDQVKGFGVRVKPSGTRSYIVQYRTRRGKARRFTIGKHGTVSTKDARKRARQILTEAVFGSDPAERARQIREAYSFRELASEYLERRKNEKIIAEDERILRKDIIPHLGNILAAEVTKRDVVELVDRIRDRGSPVMGNRTLSLIKRVYSFGISRDIIEENPAHDVKPVREQSRDRVLSEKEIRAFWHRIEDVPSTDLIKTALKLILVTAQRPGEVIRMERREIDFKAMVWNIPSEKTKNRLPHSVPLSSLAIDLLKSIPHKESQYAFPARQGRAIDINKHVGVGALSNAIRRHRNILGIDQFSAHDLRRTAASGLAALGVEHVVISMVLNHKLKGVTQIYNRYQYQREKRRALDAWANKILEISECQNGTVIPFVPNSR